MNASPVPLQIGAFVGHRMPPVLSPAEWGLLEVVRTHRASPSPHCQPQPKST